MNPATFDCLQAAPQGLAITDVTAGWAVWRSLEAAAADPVAMAIGAGCAADRVGWACGAADQGSEPVAHGR